MRGPILGKHNFFFFKRKDREPESHLQRINKADHRPANQANEHISAKEKLRKAPGEVYHIHTFLLPERTGILKINYSSVR